MIMTQGSKYHKIFIIDISVLELIMAKMLKYVGYLTLKYAGYLTHWMLQHCFKHYSYVSKCL